jgi:hypothetical protein
MKTAVLWDVTPCDSSKNRRVTKISEPGTTSTWRTTRRRRLNRPLKTPLLVSLSRRQLRHLAAWSWQTERLPTPPEQHPSIHSVHHGNRKWRPLPIPGLGYLQKTGWLSGSQSIPQAHSHQLYLNAKSHRHPDIYRRPDGSLGHKVYRKPNHTNLYLNAKSQHYPSNKQAVLSTLIHRTRAPCDEDSPQAELVFLKTSSKRMATTIGRSTQPSAAVRI